MIAEIINRTIAALAPDCDIASFSCDRAAVNVAAQRHLDRVFASAVAVPCFSHCMNSVGDRLSTFTEADVFLSELSMVTAGYHVNAAALLDSTVGSRPRGGTGTVRWWALLELNNWALENWDAIVRFICEAVDNNVCKAISLKLKSSCCRATPAPSRCSSPAARTSPTAWPRRRTRRRATART